MISLSTDIIGPSPDDTITIRYRHQVLAIGGNNLKVPGLSLMMRSSSGGVQSLMELDHVLNHYQIYNLFSNSEDISWSGIILVLYVG